MKKIDHIGIAVSNLDNSIKMYESFTNSSPFHREIIKSQNLEVAFFQFGETKIELIAGLNDNNSITNFINKRGEGQHHIAFLVDDIVQEIEDLKSKGFKPLSDKPYKGALGKMVCFFHPKTTNGVLIEICQKLDTTD